MRAARGEERPGPRAVPLATWAEIERCWPRRSLPDAVYQGRIEAFERAPVLGAGERRPVTVRVTNEGDERWPGLRREPWIKLTHRWLDEKGREAGRAGPDTDLPAPLAPGAGALVPVEVEAPRAAGDYALELDLLHEDPLRGRVVRAFDCPTRIPVAVSAPTREHVVPTGLLRRRWRRHRAPSRPSLPRLTFDDGPSEWTEALLEVLRTHRVQATFFVIGAHARRRPDLIEAAARDGHEIGNHSEDHAALPTFDDDREVVQRLVATSDLVEEITGRRPRLFRPPWGLTNDRIERLAASLGMEQVLWTKDSRDYAVPGADRIAAVIEESDESDIVLLHDGSHFDGPCNRRQTVAGVRRALAVLARDRAI